MYQQPLEQPLEKPEVSSGEVKQTEIPFPKEKTPWERLGISKEDYENLYKDDPEDPNLQTYQQR